MGFPPPALEMTGKWKQVRESLGISAQTSTDLVMHNICSWHTSTTSNLYARTGSVGPSRHHNHHPPSPRGGSRGSAEKIQTMLHTLLHNYDAHGGLGVKAHGFPHDPSALKFFVEILDTRVASRNQETPFSFQVLRKAVHDLEITCTVDCCPKQISSPGIRV